MKKIVFATLFLVYTLDGLAILSPQVDFKIDSLMELGVKKGYYPGASIAVGDRQKVVFEGYYGSVDQYGSHQVTADDVYDIASCTKIVATTLTVMRLWDDGKIVLTKTVGDYLPLYTGTKAGGATVTELLTHTSGLPQLSVYSILTKGEGKQGYISYSQTKGYREFGVGLYVNSKVDSLINARIISGYNPAKRGIYTYCDSNFYLLKQIVEVTSGKPFETFTKELYGEMSMNNTGFCPQEWKAMDRIIPTEVDVLMDRGLIQGYTHDELAAISGNIAGHAGIFSCVSDLGHFCQMMLNGGIFNGNRVVSAEAIKIFTASPLSSKGIYRGLGFDKRAPSSSLSPGFGHTGYTGTMIWIDPRAGRYMVFLSNRVCPTRNNTGLQSSELRAKLWQLVKTI